MQLRVPRPLWLAVPTVVLVVVAVGLQVVIPAHYQWVALQKLQQYGEVDGARRIGPGWLRRLVGEERMQAFDEVHSIRFNGDKSRSLRRLQVSADTDVPKQIRTLEGRMLSVASRPGPVRPVVDSETLTCIRDFPRVTHLDLSATNIADSGIEHICALQGLETLCLDGTSLSDRGVLLLKRLPRLKEVSLRGVYVTKETVAELKQALPDLKVIW